MVLANFVKVFYLFLIITSKLDLYNIENIIANDQDKKNKIDESDLCRSFIDSILTKNTKSI